MKRFREYITERMNEVAELIKTFETKRFDDLQDVYDYLGDLSDENQIEKLGEGAFSFVFKGRSGRPQAVLKVPKSMRVGDPKAYAFLKTCKEGGLKENPLAPRVFYIKDIHRRRQFVAILEYLDVNIDENNRILDQINADLKKIGKSAFDNISNLIEDDRIMQIYSKNLGHSSEHVKQFLNGLAWFSKYDDIKAENMGKRTNGQIVIFDATGP